jgi:predicted dehydrogenase
MAPLPVAVIGVGHLGSRHARIYSELPAADLVAVADINFERARGVAGEFGCQATTDYRTLLSRIRAASVAVPTSVHREVTLTLLGAGIDVLVEKPIAAEIPEAREMVEAARRNGRVLAVGHTERYNPAVEALQGAAAEPRFIEVHRLGSFSPRSLDIDVVLDLMIHDLDVVAALVRSPLASLEAVGVPVLTERLDIANARLRFANGCVANLTASRVSQEKVRKLRVFERDRYISLDYTAQEALVYRVERDPKSPERLPRIVRENLPVERQEPLGRELGDFLGAASSRRDARVTGEDGLRALELAQGVVEALKVASDPPE